MALGNIHNGFDRLKFARKLVARYHFLHSCEPVAIKSCKTRKFWLSPVDESLGCFRPQSLRSETETDICQPNTCCHKAIVTSYPFQVTCTLYQSHPKPTWRFQNKAHTYPKFPASFPIFLRCEAFLLDPKGREAIEMSPDEVLEASAVALGHGSERVQN